MSPHPKWQELLDRRPVLARELRESMRTGRPFVVVLTLAVLLSIVNLGAASAFEASERALPIGGLLYQVFFSLAFFAVAFAGAVLACAGMAAERDGKTWDALLLTGLDPGVIVRDKFWAAAAPVLALVAASAPSAVVMPFLRGVGFGDLAAGFALLSAIGVIAVGFGVAVGAGAQSTGGAVVAALAALVLGAPVLYAAAGFGASLLAHATWPDVPALSPVWLPLAYTRARFDGRYGVLLIGLPIVILSLTSWFFYELAVARVRSPSDDRSSGLKRWYLTALPCVVAVAHIPVAMTPGPARLGASLVGLGAVLLFATFAAFVLAADDLAPSRRVEHRWARSGAQWPARLLGPGLVQTSTLVMVSGLAAASASALSSAGALRRDSGSVFGPAIDLLLCAESWSAFFVFIVGLLAWARTRSASIAGARLVSIGVGATAIFAPWLVSLMAGLTGPTRLADAMLLAAPSPLYALTIPGAVRGADRYVVLASATVCSVGWTALGLALLALGARQATRRVAGERAAGPSGDAKKT